MTEDDEPVLELHIQAEVKVCRVLPLQREGIRRCAGVQEQS